MANYVLGNNEILRVAQAVASEKGIPSDAVMEAIEQGLKVAAKKKYGSDYDIDATINRKSGVFKVFRRLHVVEDVEDSSTEISYEQVKKSSGNVDEIKIGDYVTHDLPPIDLGRLVAQTVKQVIVQKVKQAENEKNYEFFKDKVNEIVSGIVKKVGPRRILLDVNGVEVLLEKDDLIQGEKIKQNDRVKGIIREVVKGESNLQIFLSRSSNEFMAKLFYQEVPEIFDGIIKIKAISREPGARAKIAVYAVESNLDPVGACVGVRGSRVQVVISELKGEKIDVIEWSEDPAKFVINALVPAKVQKVVIDEENSLIECVVSEQDYSIAIGRRGQNARLASRLTGWNIDILTEDQESVLRKQENDRVFEVFVDKLGIDEMLARFLIAEGISEVEELLMIDPEDLAQIDGLSQEKADDLVRVAAEFVESEEYREHKWAVDSLSVDLLQLRDLRPDTAFALKKHNIRTLGDVADLSTDEFRDNMSEEIEISDEEINSLIMEARKIAYDIKN